MNIFKFLKSRIGAVSISGGKAAVMALSAGMLAVNVYNYANNTPAAQEARVRSFSEVLASGGTLPGDNTMNFALGNVQFASAEERAAQEGTIFDAGDADVSALQGAMNSFSVRGSALGAGEGGLGMGAKAAVELGPDGKPLTGNAAGTDGAAVGAAAAAAAQGGQTKINKLGEEPAGGLQRASIARASGSNLGSSSAGGFGGVVLGRIRPGTAAAPPLLGALAPHRRVDLWGLPGAPCAADPGAAACRRGPGSAPVAVVPGVPGAEFCAGRGTHRRGRTAGPADAPGSLSAAFRYTPRAGKATAFPARFCLTAAGLCTVSASTPGTPHIPPSFPPEPSFLPGKNLQTA